MIPESVFFTEGEGVTWLTVLIVTTSFFVTIVTVSVFTKNDRVLPSLGVAFVFGGLACVLSWVVIGLLVFVPPSAFAVTGAGFVVFMFSRFVGKRFLGGS